VGKPEAWLVSMVGARLGGLMRRGRKGCVLCQAWATQRCKNIRSKTRPLGWWRLERVGGGAEVARNQS
jgi:hypothetical protein